MTMPTDDQIERLIRAIEELGFNGAVSRRPGEPAIGIGERIVFELERIANAIEHWHEREEGDT